MKGYGFPLWQMGKTIHGENGNDRTITLDECNKNCHCTNPFASHMCMEGHMTECHAGMTCRDAECAHWEQQIDLETESAETDFEV